MRRYKAERLSLINFPQNDVGEREENCELFHVTLELRLVDLSYNFECDCFIELFDNKLSNNKLSDNNLESELVDNMNFLKPITIEEIVIFMIKLAIELFQEF